MTERDHDDEPSADEAGPTPTSRARKKRRTKSADARAEGGTGKGGSALEAARSNASTPSWRSRPVLIALVLGLAAGGGGGFYAGQRIRPARAQRPEPGPAFVELAAWSPRKGPAHAKVTLIEFSDFQ